MQEQKWCRCLVDAKMWQMQCSIFGKKIRGIGGVVREI